MVDVHLSIPLLDRPITQYVGRVTRPLGILLLWYRVRFSKPRRQSWDVAKTTLPMAVVTMTADEIHTFALRVLAYRERAWKRWQAGLIVAACRSLDDKRKPTRPYWLTKDQS
jgi:hypothetical protein